MQPRRRERSKDTVLKTDLEMVERLGEVYGTQEAKLEACRSNASNRKLANASLISVTDPDVPCVKKKTAGESRPCHKVHRAVDDANGVVTATITSPGDSEENAKMLGLLHLHSANIGGLPASAVADSRYGTAANYRDLTALRVESYMLLHAGRKRDTSVFAADCFRYAPGSDTYECPAGKYLYPKILDKIRMSTEYVVCKGTWDLCRLRPQCTKAKMGRTVQRRWGRS